MHSCDYPYATGHMVAPYPFPHCSTSIIGSQALYHQNESVIMNPDRDKLVSERLFLGNFRPWEREYDPSMVISTSHSSIQHFHLPNTTYLPSHISPSFMADPKHHQHPEPPPPGLTWFSGQFQYQDHFPSPPPPNHNQQQWAPPPSPHAPYSVPPSYSAHHQYQSGTQDWQNPSWVQHRDWEYPTHNNGEDSAAEARAWAAAETSTDDQYPHSQFTSDGRMEENQYPIINPHHSEVQHMSLPASSYQQYPPSVAPPYWAPESTSFSSGYVPDCHLPFTTRDETLIDNSNDAFHHQESSPLSLSVHQQEVPPSYSSVAGKEDVSDQNEKLYKSPWAFTSIPQHHAPLPLAPNSNHFEISIKSTNSSCEVKVFNEMPQSGTTKEHVQHLQRLQEEDPESYQFLKKHDKELLEFDEEKEEEDEDIETNIDGEEMQEDEEAELHHDKHEVIVVDKEERTSKNVLISAMVDTWCNAIRENASLGALPVHIQFLGNYVTELLGVDLSAAYQHAIVFIQQLAMILLEALTMKTKETFRKVYEWKYMNRLELWTGAICAYSSEVELSSPAYSLTQIISGVSCFVPTARCFLLRLHCVRMVNRIVASIGLIRAVLITVANGCIIRVYTVDISDSVKALGNSSSLSLRWKMKICDKLALWDDVNDLATVQLSWERFLVLLNSSVPCIVRAIVGFIHTLSHHHFTKPSVRSENVLTDAVRLQLLYTLRICLEFSLSFFSPVAKLNISISGGNYSLNVVVNDTLIVEVIESPPDLQCLQLLLAPKGLGTALDTVYDTGLAPPMAASSVVKVADLDWLKITLGEQISLMEGSSQVVDFLAGVNDGHTFDFSQYIYMNIHVHIEDHIVDVVDSYDITSAIDGYVRAPNFIIQARHLGVTILYLSARQQYGLKVLSQPIKIEVYPHSIHRSDIFFVPGASFVLSEKGGPTVGSYVKYASMDDETAIIHKTLRRLNAIAPGNTTLIAIFHGNGDKVIYQAYGRVIVGVPSSVMLNVQSHCKNYAVKAYVHVIASNAGVYRATVISKLLEQGELNLSYGTIPFVFDPGGFVKLGRFL